MKWLLPTYLLHLSIRRKLMLLIMFTCGLILLATTMVFVAKETGSLIHEQHRNLSSLADILGKNISASLTFNDPKSALDTMNSLSVKSDILAAYILRPDTTIFARYLATGIQAKKLPFEQLGPTPSVDSSRSVLEKLKTDSNHFLQLNDRVTLITPIRLDDYEIGTVVLFADMRELRSRLLDTLLISSLILVLAAIAAYLLSMRLQGIISDPILQLSDAMHKVSKTKEFSLRVVKAGNDEIGRLYDGFNEMLHEIEERDLVLCQRQEHLENLAHFDPLTRLPNRMLFHDRLQQAMCLALRADQVIALMFLDLDRFKDINDTLGHRIGDLLLRHAADRMSLVLRDCDTIARLGGDEFTIFTQNIIDAENAGQVAHKLLNMFETPFTIEGQEIYITCSIGIALFPADAEIIDDLLMHADIAMYHAKSDGKNTFRHYNREMKKQTSERIGLLADLRKALELEQLYLQYQPKFDVSIGCLVGVEALLRWQHPEKGLIPPAKFIPLAEESGSIIAITDWVLKTACHQTKQWHDAGYGMIPVAVNLSACSFKQNNLQSQIKETLETTGLLPELLELELTESILIENDKQAEETLRELHKLGIKITIDDFGTGYSSLSYLHRFPISVLKIDRSFVWNMHRSENDMAIVVAIIAMAHSLKLQVVAEGVETEEQLNTLKKNGCEIIQGYLTGKPTDSSGIVEQLQKNWSIEGTERHFSSEE